jgi:CHAT domain-containing protein/Flp pilus assembly protein TadD
VRFGTLGDLKESERIIEQGRQAMRHPLLRMSMAMHQVSLRLARGDTAGALALRHSLRAAVDRDGRPGMRALFEETPCYVSAWGEVEDLDARDRRAIERPRARGDWALVERTLIECGHWLIDRGEHLRALRHLTQALTIADSVRLPDLYLSLYTQRGRAYLRLGRLGDAERDLRRALELGAGAGRFYNVADVHHNLAHMYEGLGRWRDASREIDRYVALTRPMHWTIHFTSLLDAGEIRWKAGWHASARAAFEEMVRIADEDGANYSYAGAYYERIGDLQRARQYYVKARSELGEDLPGLSGLARVYEKLGQVDSAEAIARVHDAQEALWPLLEVPLMPAILARQGRSAEALNTARAFAARQEQRGNVQGASLAFLQLARFAIDARSANVALVAATHAESLATTLHLANESIQAATLRGRALQQLGSGDSAVSTLRRAAQMASRDATTDNLLETHLALGDALAERGQADAALAAYDRAARTAEHVTESLLGDLDRARYRDRHLLPFDGAVRVLVREDFRAVRANQLVAWSARRKAAALALATHISAGSVADPSVRVTLGDVQRRLGERDALLDYLVLDSVVAVMAITRERASLVRLPVTKDSLAAMVARLRHPLVTVYGGRLDLTRAPFDLATAALLHSVLVRPLATALVGIRRLIIVPDGPLHALSFEALVVTPPTSRAGAPDYAGANYLIDTHEVEYLLSSSFLTEPDRQRDVLSGSRLLVVSYGAPGAEQEASALRGAWRADRTTLLGGTAATERATKAELSRFGVIHFVVHAQASARDPLTSHLRLAPDSIEDSYLNLDEIAAAKLSARLVVLSACETDAGPILNGEGVMGLARAFLASGAHAVVGTQWPVGPTMAELMQQFYRRLAAGEAPSPALRGAKLALRTASATAHPFYWAGAVLVTGGDGQ